MELITPIIGIIIAIVVIGIVVYFLVGKKKKGGKLEGSGTSPSEPKV